MKEFYVGIKTKWPLILLQNKNHRIKVLILDSEESAVIGYHLFTLAKVTSVKEFGNCCLK